MICPDLVLLALLNMVFVVHRLRLRIEHKPSRILFVTIDSLGDTTIRHIFSEGRPQCLDILLFIQLIADYNLGSMSPEFIQLRLRAVIFSESS